MSDTAATTLMERTALIVTAHLQHNPLTTEQVPAFIRIVHATLAALGGETAATEETTDVKGMNSQKLDSMRAEKPPVVDPRRSVFPDYIICLEDGKQLKMLKRHLATAYGLTPEEYRAKWNLGEEYPMVAPRYAELRSSLAKRNGLGIKTANRKPGRQLKA